MSERARTSRRRVAVAVALVLSAGVAEAQAPTAAELSARRDSLNRRYAAAQARLDSAENRARAVPDSTLDLEGAKVYFRTSNLDERERAALARAFERAAEELDVVFGEGGRRLMEGQIWVVTAGRSQRRSDAGLGLDAIEGNQRTTTASLSVPLNVSDVVDVVRGQAGRRLVSTAPIIRDWLGGGFSIDEPMRIHYFAHRQLALHESSPARRCARGNIAACADLVDPSARNRWFDADDKANPNRVPVSGIVRESLLRYAVEQDGPAVLRALADPAREWPAPVPLIAAALGQTSDEFLRGWQAEIAQSGAVRVKATPGTVLAAFGWFAFCGLLATRRRPQ